MMMSVKRFAKISAFLCIFWLLVLGISTKTRAVENSSSTIETHTISSAENKEPQSKISTTTNSDSTTLSTEESSIENQINLQPTVKANKEYGSELLTSVSLTDIANNLVHRVKNSDKIKVNYSFSLPDEAQAGDALTFELPAILQMVNYSDFPLLSKMGSEIGIAKIDRATNIEAVTPSETRESELSSEPSTTETTNASQSTTSIQNEKNSGNQQQLLKTGENKSPLLVLIGVLLLLVATWILVAKKQVEN